MFPDYQPAPEPQPPASDAHVRSRERLDQPGERLAALPSHARLLWVWLSLGLQSFGGGTATQFLIRRTFVERYRWIAPADFTRWWAICPLTPGINLLALTVLIGWHLARGIGVLLALGGLLLPSVTITAAMTAAYALIRDHPLVAAALRGVVPASVGLGLLMAWQLAGPLLVASRREGWASVVVSTVLLLGSGAATAWFHPSVILLLCLAGVVGAVTHWRAHGTR